MTVEKVTVSKELADAIEHVRNHCRIERLGRYVDGEGKPSHPKVVLALNELDKDSLLHAIFYGYEIDEMSPEEKVREYYSEFSVDKRYLTGSQYAVGYAILHTLKLLGIKIEGVNG